VTHRNETIKKQESISTRQLDFDPHQRGLLNPSFCTSPCKLAAGGAIVGLRPLGTDAPVCELVRRAQRTKFESVAKAFGQAGTNPLILAFLTMASAVP
jgi:hypothetical protein